MYSSIFSRRPNFSTFNLLPRTKINSYHIRMEDATSHANDDIRTLILSTLSANGMNRVHCVVCSSNMPIFERFPLIDGTFFLSPRQHSKAAVQLVGASIERKFLNAVCMGCMEGWSCNLNCRSCLTKWDGSHLILGSMYSYDIFAAIPCCIARLNCANCDKLAIAPGRRLEYFSDYSQKLACAHCGQKDFHFAKPLNITFTTSTTVQQVFMHDDGKDKKKKPLSQIQTVTETGVKRTRNKQRKRRGKKLPDKTSCECS